MTSVFAEREGILFGSESKRDAGEEEEVVERVLKGRTPQKHPLKGGMGLSFITGIQNM